VRVDDLGVSEPAATSEPVAAVRQPPPTTGEEAASAVTQPIPVVTSERCSQCAAPLAADQRYCLQCGAPRPHVNGPISGGRPSGRSPQAASASQAAPGLEARQTPPTGTPGVLPGAPPEFAAPTTSRNNTLALLAGIGVLLLAMGVGVLIGRADSGSAKVPPPQVISVGGGAAAGSATSATTPTTTPAETPAAATAKKTAKSSSSSSSSSSNSGASLSKPAPPTALKSVSKAQSGSSYEQKSKNLPDVVETG
jgi:hypothetical protein